MVGASQDEVLVERSDPRVAAAGASRPRFRTGAALGHDELLLKADPLRLARFDVEARATAQLSHENIVALHDIGEHEGVPFMVLEHVPDKSLSAWLAERAESEGRGVGLPPTRAAELMLKR